MSSPSTSCGQCYLELDEVGSRDVCSLDCIDEEALLSNLHKRFKKDQIYVSISPENNNVFTYPCDVSLRLPVHSVFTLILSWQDLFIAQ